MVKSRLGGRQEQLSGSDGRTEFVSGEEIREMG